MLHLSECSSNLNNYYNHVFCFCMEFIKQTLLNTCCLCAPQLNDLTERNAECVEMLHESQEEIKELRSKNTPSAGMRRHLSYGLYPMVSETHSEIHTAALRKEALHTTDRKIHDAENEKSVLSEDWIVCCLFVCRTPWQQRSRAPWGENWV